MIPKKCNQLKGWTLFLDRDGVINKRLMGDYVKSIDEFEFLSGAQQAIAWFNSCFDRIFVVTNQQGIGKGVMSEQDLSEVHTFMKDGFDENPFNAIYYAPQLANEGSIYRKPNPGMALQARKEYPEVDFSQSIMVGDSVSDIQMGKRCGMKTVGIGLEDKIECDLHVNSLNELMKYFEE